MKTEAGKKIAEKRHEFMEAYLQQFHLEIDGQCWLIKIDLGFA